MLHEYDLPVLLPKPVRECLKAGAVIAGGYARVKWCDGSDMASHTIPTDDIDIWIPTVNGLSLFEDNPIEVACLDIIQRYSEGDGYKSTNGWRYHFAHDKYNIIRADVRPFHNGEELIETFDFTVTQAFMTDKKLYVTSAFISDVVHDKLAFIDDYKIVTPLGSMTRVAKYVKKGFKPSHNIYIDIMEEWAKLGEQERAFHIAMFREFNGEGQGYGAL